MTSRPIRLFGDPILKTVCQEVEDPSSLKSLVQDLLDCVRLPGRAGVAANQIGYALRVFSYNIEGKVGYVINPKLIETSDEPNQISEACLSLPDLGFETPRFGFARVRGIDLSGNQIEVTGEGLWAQMLQHECDHLDGLLYIDRLEKDRRKEAMRALRQTNWFLVG